MNWIGRKPLARTFRAAFAAVLPLAQGPPDRDDSPDPMARLAVWGFLLSFAALVGFCRAAGMSLWTPIVLLALSLTYLVAATRIRAETGNAWLFGPDVDPQRLMITAVGARHILPRDLTIMAYLNAVSSFDLRCVSMPHQLDAFKLAEVRKLERGRLTGALLLGLAVGIPVAFNFSPDVDLQALDRHIG